jgi:hypothetical protein
MVAETSEGEATHCFPSRGALLSAHTPAPAACVSHDRVAPAHVQIGTNLCVTAMPRPPPLPSALAVTHTHVAAHARATAASKSHVHSGVTATAKDRTQATARACRGVRITLLGRCEIRRCLLQSRHHVVGFSFPDSLDLKELGFALPLVASLHKELPSSPQQEQHVMVSSGDQPLIVFMDRWFTWDQNDSWICSTTLMDVRNKYKPTCKRLIFKSLFSLV